MISHLTVGVTDLERSSDFYRRVLGPLGWLQVHRDEQYHGFAAGITPAGRPAQPMFWICLPFDGQPASVGNGVHVAFDAPDDAAVERAWRTALDAGGVDEGRPCWHPEYHLRYYGAFFRDLDGNKLQVCCHTWEPPGTDIGGYVAEGGCG